MSYLSNEFWLFYILIESYCKNAPKFEGYGITKSSDGKGEKNLRWLLRLNYLSESNDLTLNMEFILQGRIFNIFTRL